MDLNDYRINRRLTLKPERIEEIYSLISEIDSVKNSWHITGKLLPQTIERLTHSVIVTSTGASNRIEGNCLSDIEVESLYKNIHIKRFKTRDEQEIAGYLESLELIFRHYGDMHITEPFILKLHNDTLIYSDKDAGHKGQYKFSSNRVEAKDHLGEVIGVIFDPTPPYLVKKEMQELVEWYKKTNEVRVKHPLILIANFIFEYLAIHPFQDGNGRTSRLITNLMLLQQGYLFTQLVSHERIIEERKIEYYLALSKTQFTWKKTEEDITPWLIFFLKIVQAQSSQALKLINGDNIEYLLSEKQLMLWNWAQHRAKDFTRKDAIEALNIPPRTVESIIKKLVTLRKLKMLGQGKATRYQLID